MAGGLVVELKDQFHRQWETLREAIGNTPDADWREPQGTSPAPARLVYHVLAGTEVYARSTPYERYLLERRFPGDWQTEPSDRLPTRTAAVESTRLLERAVERWLDELSDEGLAAPNAGFEWSGALVVGRALYLLRHTQNHLGELNALLKRLGAAAGKWR